MNMSHMLLCQDQADKDSSYKLISAGQICYLLTVWRFQLLDAFLPVSNSCTTV